MQAGGGLVSAQRLGLQGAAGAVKASGAAQRLSPGRKLCSMPVRASCFRSCVAEVVVEGGADVFAGDVDAADAFVVGGERHRHVRGAVEREGMVSALHAQNALIRAEIDLDHHVLLRPSP